MNINCAGVLCSELARIGRLQPIQEENETDMDIAWSGRK